jgi:outer membrane protein assembly factor BamE
VFQTFASKNCAPFTLPRAAAALLLLVFLAGCTYLTPYKIEIQQGNVIDKADLALLKSGMTRQQVTQVLGTPLVADIYHANRWDYVHYLRRRGRMLDRRNVTLVFEEDRLAKLEGEGVPALKAADDATPPPSARQPDSTEVPVATPMKEGPVIPPPAASESEPAREKRERDAVEPPGPKPLPPAPIPPGDAPSR